MLRNVPLFTAGLLFHALLYPQIHERLKSFEKRRPLPVQERAASLASDVSLNSLRRQDAQLAESHTARAKNLTWFEYFPLIDADGFSVAQKYEGDEHSFLNVAEKKKPPRPQGWLLKDALDACHSESALTKKAARNINISAHSCD